MKIMKHNIGLYLRVSTDEQAQVIEGSLDSQKHRLQNFAEIKNVQEPNWGKIVDTYTDEGLSAKDTRRPAFQRMLKDMRSGRINLLLVTDLSRLSRSILDFCILLEDLKKHNAKFLSLKEQFDTSTPAGEMMVFNMINLAQFERKQTSERVALNFHARALRGLSNGGSAPLGFDKDPHNPSRYVINEYEAASVRRIFEIYRTEGTLTKTLKGIEAEGIQPKIPKNETTVPATRFWNTSILSRFLRNLTYVGLREVNVKNKDVNPENLRNHEKYQVVKASWEPLVDEDTFNLVQNTLKENLRMERTRRGEGANRVFLLTGIMYCEECGRPLTGTSGTGRGKTFRYYVHAPIRNKPVLCEIKTIPATEIEKKVLNHLDEVLFREGYLDSIERRYEYLQQQKSGDLETSILQCTANLEQINKEIQATLKLLTKMIDQGLDHIMGESLKRLNQQKLKAETELESLKSRVQAPINPQENRKFIEIRATDLKRAKAKATPAMLKRLIHKVIEAISISPEKARIAYWSSDKTTSVDLTSKKMASADKSSAEANQTNPSAVSGKRKLVLVQSFQEVPPLPGEVESSSSCGVWEIENGWGARIRT
jgi:site-specific DNA recombinase